MANLAQAYAHVIKDASGKEGGAKFADRLVTFMKSRGHLSLLPSVIRMVERMPHADAAVVTVKNKEDLERYKTAIKASLEALHAPGKPEVIIDPRLVGGFAVRAQGKAIDKSFRTALISIYQNIVRS